MSRATIAMVLALLVAGGARAASYTVDLGSPGRQVFSLNGVNAGPGHMKHQPGGDVTAQYRQMGVRMVRTHDYYGPCDLSQIFPNLWNPTGRRQMPHFAETDAAVSEIEAAGGEVLFRLGESWYSADPHNHIPLSFGAVAAACKAIVAHFGGHECTPLKGRIRLWEIWNEPNHSMFWDLAQDPNCDQFIEMYVQVARELRAEFPWIKIGGPGAKGDSAANQAAFAGRLAEACRDADAPLDFYSWHYYNGERGGPGVFAEHARAIRQALNAAGCGKTLNVLDEWNSTMHKPESQGLSEEDRAWNATLGNLTGAAFTASALIYLHQDSDVRYACRYRGDYWQPEDGYGLINADGSLKRPGYALQAYGMLFPAPADRRMFELESSGGDDEHRAIMATADRTPTVANILISQYQTGSQGFTLTVKGIPANWQRPTLEHYIVSAQHDCERILQRELKLKERPRLKYEYSGSGLSRRGSSVHLVRLYDASRFPVFTPGEIQPAKPPLKPPGKPPRWLPPRLPLPGPGQRKPGRVNG
ncbi:MAG: hypothetical protein KKI08_04655 [Armatimonadetes bacterium]|nr:hypothetical protein [Armatimonadota bacterium]